MFVRVQWKILAFAVKIDLEKSPKPNIWFYLQNCAA